MLVNGFSGLPDVYIVVSDMPAKLPRHSLNLVSTTVTAVMLLACVFLRRTIARMRGLNADNRELELTSNCTIPELSGRRNFSSSGSDFSSSPASSTMPLPDFHQHAHQQHHSHVNRSYTNTYSSCSSFKLPNIIGNFRKTLSSLFYFRVVGVVRVVALVFFSRRRDQEKRVANPLAFSL